MASKRGNFRGRTSLAVLVCAIVCLWSAGLPAGAAAEPPLPNPLAAASYLAQQRAGFGSPAHAAMLAAAADAKAGVLRSHPIPATSSSANFSGAWGSLGPAPVTQSFYGANNSGRIDSIAVVQTGASAGEIFVGTAGGGVWSSTDNGATWTTHTDNVSTGLAIGALAIDPGNPSIIYAGTGEANNCGDCFYGGGVLKSTDGGASWSVLNPSGLFNGVDFGSIAVDPNNSAHLLAGTTSGLFVSSDGGASWAHPTGTGSFTSSTYGIALDPATSPTTVYVGTVGVGVQKSTDGGVNFTTLGGGLPAAATFGVTQLGIGTNTASHPTADQTLYAAVQLQSGADASGGDVSMFKSTDGGTSWTLLKIPAYTNQAFAYGSGTADQAFYDTAIAVDPANPSHVIAVGIAPVEVTDGGSTTSAADWTNINGKSFFAAGTNVVHPDFHAVTFTATGKAVLGCDGGAFEYDPTKGAPAGVTNINGNLNTIQAYADLGVFNNGATILGGFQDNGTGLFTGALGWPDVNSGDGGYNVVNPLDSNQLYDEADMHLFLQLPSSGATTDISPPSGVNGNFVPPMTLVPNASSVDNPTVYYGGADLWVTHNPSSVSRTWTQLTSVGQGVSAVAVAPSNPADVYVGFDNGTLLVSTNATSGSPTFTAISPGVAQWITHIDVNPTNPAAIAVSFSSSNAQFSSVPPMVETGAVTLGATPTAAYTNITGDLPSGVASNAVVSDQGSYVVATDVGTFFTATPNAGSTHWTPAGTGLPNVQVLGLTVDGNGSLYAATHGRGVWKLLVPGPTGPAITTDAATGVTSTGASLVATINPNGSDTMYRYEYGTDTTFGTVIGPFDAGSGTTLAMQPGQAITGLQPATTYYYRACGNNALDPGVANQVCGSVVAFTTAGGPTPPSAITKAASALSGTGATLNGTVTAHGAQTAYVFEYGTTLNFGQIAPSPSGNAGLGTAGVAASAAITGLQPHTTYFYRLVAANGQGTTLGTVMSFTTTGTASAPVVSTGAATGVGSTGATLNGTVDPEGQTTAFTFEYGTSTSFGNITAFDNAGNSGAVENVSLPATGLMPNTTYLYRIVATNATGTTNGAVMSFKTGP